MFQEEGSGATYFLSSCFPYMKKTKMLGKYQTPNLQDILSLVDRITIESF